MVLNEAEFFLFKMLDKVNSMMAKLLSVTVVIIYNFELNFHKRFSYKNVEYTRFSCVYKREYNLR